MSLASRFSSRKVPWNSFSRRHASTFSSSSTVGVSRAKNVFYTVVGIGAVAGFAGYYADSRAAMHQYVISPLLRTLVDAETGHKIALRVLRSGLGAKDQGHDDPRLRVELWGEEIANPVGLAAGFDKDGEAIDGLFDLGFGWVEIGSVTPQAQLGNARPRVFHLSEDRAVINRYGFPSKGAVSVLTRLQGRYQRYAFTDSKTLLNSTHASLREGKLLSVNLGKNKASSPDSISDFLVGVKTFGPWADVLVINVSSPNTPGLRNLQSRGMLIELLDGVRRERDALVTHRKLPRLLVKIAPDLTETELEDIAEAVRETRLDGVIVSNTTVQRPNEVKSRNKSEAGGLSGPPLKNLTLKALRTLRTHLPPSVPIIGCGGISSGVDAIEYAKAGATTVQLYTSLAYDGVGTPRRIKDEITSILKNSNQTWMDLVQEGQRLALQEAKIETEKKSVAQEVADALGMVINVGKERSVVLKPDNVS